MRSHEFCLTQYLEMLGSCRPGHFELLSNLADTRLTVYQHRHDRVSCRVVADAVEDEPKALDIGDRSCPLGHNANITLIHQTRDDIADKGLTVCTMSHDDKTAALRNVSKRQRVMGSPVFAPMVEDDALQPFL